jgi:hypothetical protein
MTEEEAVRAPVIADAGLCVATARGGQVFVVVDGDLLQGHGLLTCDLDTNHQGPHYCGAEEIWWLPGGSAERHDPTFEPAPDEWGVR